MKHHYGVRVFTAKAVAFAQQIDLILIFVAAQFGKLLQPMGDGLAVLFLDARKMRRSFTTARRHTERLGALECAHHFNVVRVREEIEHFDVDRLIPRVHQQPRVTSSCNCIA